MSKSRPLQWKRTLPQAPHQILRPQVRIPLQHLQGLVPRDRRDLHGIQSLLEEPGGRLTGI